MNKENNNDIDLTLEDLLGDSLEENESESKEDELEENELEENELEENELEENESDKPESEENELEEDESEENELEENESEEDDSEEDESEEYGSEEDELEENELDEKSDNQEMKDKKDTETAEKLAERLELWNRSSRDLFVDLRMFTFTADDENMFLTCNDQSYYDRPLYFKVDQENPRDPKILLAQKQFCKIVGVPHSFFLNNRPSLRNEIVKTWQAGLDTDSQKARCIARIRESKDYCVIRAFLPEANNRLQNHDLIRLIDECSHQSKMSFFLEFATGDNRDDLILHARFLSDKVIDVLDSKCRLGFSVTASELGAGPLEINTLLHHIDSKTAFIASYGAEPFFSSRYEGIQAQDIKEMLPNMIDRLFDEGIEMKNRIESELIQIVPHEECIKINSWTGVPRKFKRALFHEASAKKDDMLNTWDFARHISLIAKDFSSKKRLVIERLSGRYLNLSFGKN